jgi:DNA-directed RNA polymerase III subunit RPC1
LTASWVITSKDRFFTKEEFNQVIAGFLTDHTSWLDIELPPPTIWKPLQLWTGKQIFSILISPNKKDPVKLTMDCKLKNYNQKTHPGLPPFMSWDDQWMVVADGELLAGQLDKGVLGGGKTTLFAHMLKHYSPEVAADRMSKLARMCARYLMNHGFSIGISDVTPSPALIKSKNELITKGYNEATELIQKAKSGQMQADPGSSLEATLEGKLSGVLSELRDKAGNQCTDDLSANFPLNSPLIMTLCGSKGSKINIAQMISCVGQQTVSGSRYVISSSRLSG